MDQEPIKPTESAPDLPQPPGPDNPGSMVMTMAEWIEEFEKQEKREPTAVELVMCMAHLIDMNDYVDAKAQIEQARLFRQKMVEHARGGNGNAVG